MSKIKTLIAHNDIKITNDIPERRFFHEQDISRED